MDTHEKTDVQHHHHFPLGNANQNYKKVHHFIPTRMAILKKLENNYVSKVKKLKLSYIAGGNAKWCNCYEEQYLAPQTIEKRKRVKQRITIWPSNSISKYITKRI